MQWIPYIVAYAGIAVFLVAVVARFLMWSKMPMHVRWELYPVAHEGKRASYGGSYLEEGEWWKKPREVSLVGELKVMVPEILFLVALRESNPKLWIRSLPFHFGLYVVTACTVLMMLAGGMGALWPGALDGTLGDVIGAAIPVLGGAGLVLSLLGAAGLFQRRWMQPELRSFSAKADFLNLGLFLVVFGVALVNFLLVDRDFAHVTAYVAGLVTFDPSLASGSTGELLLSAVSMSLMAGLVAYIPLTHMSHFIGKYFAYHSIRWNDTPNLRGGPQEKKIAAVLGQPVSWAAPHIDGQGKKTWVDLATEDRRK